MRPSIRAYLDKYDYCLDNWEEIIEKAINTKGKAVGQARSLIKKINSQCAQGYWFLRNEYFKRNVEAKKPPPSNLANRTCG